MGITLYDDDIKLPFLPRLGISTPPVLSDEDVNRIATEFIDRFSKAVESDNTDNILSLFIGDGIWRDMLAFTWTFSTILGVQNIRKMLDSRMGEVQMKNIRPSIHKHYKFHPAPPLLWIRTYMDFDTTVGHCSAIINLVPTPSSSNDIVEWKVFTFYTNLEGLKGFPERIGVHRDLNLRNPAWKNPNRDRTGLLPPFEKTDPSVILIGAGHAGLMMAARLKVLGVETLVVDRCARVGDTWRNRYRSLCLHDPIWGCHFPYLPFPENWPGYPPASKFADWLEFYVQMMDLDVWTSTHVKKVERDETNNRWNVRVVKADGTERVFQPTYIVSALGLGDPYTPDISGRELFKGKILNTYSYTEPTDETGKKVAVIGTGVLGIPGLRGDNTFLGVGHDVAQDLYNYGAHVTMVQRSSCCVITRGSASNIMMYPSHLDDNVSPNIKDRNGASLPLLILKKLHQLAVPRVKQADKELLEKLEEVGFRLNHGPEDSGYFFLALTKQGGYYINAGTSQLIIDRKIKLKTGPIKSFATNGLIFEDDSFLQADTVVFATGLKGTLSPLVHILDPEDWKKLTLFGLSDEGEARGAYTESGLPNFYMIVGNLPMCRFYSSHIALAIKAKEENLFTTMYKPEL
ncbi:hypothetical protein Clacol_003176 [Clathrus columnatus]|uniref:Flavin-containing monooxygenase n=1 Tax=Clathrus columnatus TaxID=1419009 RepID=A0AAV5A2R3_9AGAM|nr:hypothetical protein Clacol_003176 [Clathrus columnatus]